VVLIEVRLQLEGLEGTRTDSYSPGSSRCLRLWDLCQPARESEDQSLEPSDDTNEANRVLVRVAVTSVNPATRQLTAQLSFDLVRIDAADHFLTDLRATRK
jgi:hypothetical protein